MICFFAVLMILLILACFSTFQVEAKIIIKNGTNYSFLVIRLFRGLLRIRLNVSLSSLGEGDISLIFRKTDSELDHQATAEEILRFIMKNYKGYTRYAEVFKPLISKTTIENFSIDLKIGLDDAAQTALLSGSIITIFSSLKGYLKKKFRLKTNHMKLSPYFNNRIFDMEIDCIIHVKLGHIIITGIRMLIQRIKGGEISGRTSY